MPRLNAKNNAETTLAANIDNAVTSFDVVDATLLPSPPFRVTIDDEILEVSAVSGNTLTVARGVEDTTPASHSSGASVENRLTSGTYAELVNYDYFGGVVADGVDGVEPTQTGAHTVTTAEGVVYQSGTTHSVPQVNHAITQPLAGDLGSSDFIVAGTAGDPYVVEGTDGASTLAYRIEQDNVISARYRGREAEVFEGLCKVWSTAVTGSASTGWASYNNSAYSGESALLSRYSGVKFYVAFFGTGLDWKTIKDSNSGITGVKVDGGAETTFDCYNASNQHAVIPVASGLPLGWHEAEFYPTGSKNTSSSDIYICIDAFDIHLPQAPALPADTQEIAEVLVMPQAGQMASLPARPTSAEEAGWYRVEDDDASVSYVGSGWGVQTHADFSGETIHSSTTVNDYAELTFTGNRIRVFAETGPQHGIFGVTIDDEPEVLVDTYSGGYIEKQVVFESPALIVDAHTVKLRITGTKNSSSGNVKLTLDAFEVYNPLALTDLRTTSAGSSVSEDTIAHSPSIPEVPWNNVGDALRGIEQARMKTDEGNNPDGYYAKFSDGFMMCHGSGGVPASYPSTFTSVEAVISDGDGWLALGRWK